jgi:hypothetical protein
VLAGRIGSGEGSSSGKGEEPNWSNYSI